jgi:hypothetical protein
MNPDCPIAVDWPCEVNAHRKPAWSSKPAAVAKEPITAGCWLPRRRRSGSPLACHRVSRCAACRVLITGRAAITAGRLDRVLCSESSMAPIKPPEDRFGNSAPSRWSRKCQAWDWSAALSTGAGWSQAGGRDRSAWGQEFDATTTDGDIPPLPVHLVMMRRAQQAAVLDCGCAATAHRGRKRLGTHRRWVQARRDPMWRRCARRWSAAGGGRNLAHSRPDRPRHGPEPAAAPRQGGPPWSR